MPSCALWRQVRGKSDTGRRAISQAPVTTGDFLADQRAAAGAASTPASIVVGSVGSTLLHVPNEQYLHPGCGPVEHSMLELQMFPQVSGCTPLPPDRALGAGGELQAARARATTKASVRMPTVYHD